MKRNTLLGIAMICMAIAVAAFWLFKGSDADASTEDETQMVDRRNDDMDAVLREMRKLGGEVQYMKLRLATQGAERPQAPLPDEAVPEESAEEPEADEPEADAPEAESPEAVALKEHEDRVAFYSDSFNEEARDESAAAEFEASISEAVNASGHSEIGEVDCRSTMCRLEVLHNDTSGRQRFAEFGFGPLRYGAYVYPTEDGQKTIAYVGMPNHSLPRFNASNRDVQAERL